MITRCLLFFYILVFVTVSASADKVATQRTSQFFNSEVNVWKTIIYPHKNQILKMHRHDHNRVIIALDNGKLKIVNNKGKVHYLTLQRKKAYFLPKDVPNELHTDENLSTHSIEVIVVEIKK